MTIQITMPTTATDRAIAMIQADSERMRKLTETTRHFTIRQDLVEKLQFATTGVDRAMAKIAADSKRTQKLIDATTKPYGDIHALAEKLRLPTVTVPSGLAESIAVANRVAESFRSLNQPRELLARLQGTIRETEAMAKRFDALTAPIRADQRRFAKVIAATQALAAQPVRIPSLSIPGRMPQVPVGFGGPDFQPAAPIVRIASRASIIVDFARERLKDAKRRYGDIRHRVELIVHLQCGDLLRANDLSAQDDGMIKVIGIDAEGFTRYVYISSDAMQYEIATILLPPPGAKLSLVE